MSIELIIFLVLWLISTEVILFTYAKYEFDSFFEGKIISIFLGFIIVFFLFGFPAMAATRFTISEEAVGNIIYVWYYGIMLAIALFFGVNYLIYRKVNKNGR